MRLNEIEFETGQPPVDSYGAGGFRISGEWHEGALILLPTGLQPFTGLSAEGLQPVIEMAEALDVLLIGMGSEIAALPAPLRTALEEAAIGVETMSTPSACRTYNVLLAEERRVAAILLPV